MKFNQGWFFCLFIEEKSTSLFCKKVGKKLLSQGCLGERTLKPLAPGEVSRLVVTERELQQQAFPTVWSNFFFQAKKKEAKKSLATTTATVSQTPQRFQVREKTNACYFTVGTDVLGCPIVVLSKSKRDSINRTISFCIIQMTSSRGEGLPPPAIHSTTKKERRSLVALFFNKYLHISFYLI